jgi:hypothetical protein
MNGETPVPLLNYTRHDVSIKLNLRTYVEHLRIPGVHRRDIPTKLTMILSCLRESEEYFEEFAIDKDIGVIY